MNKRREAYTVNKGCDSVKTQKQTCEELVVNFRKLVATGPTFVCTSCDQLWYKHSLVRTETVLKLNNEAVQKCIRTSNEQCHTAQWVCRTCYSYLKQNKVPPCAVQNKMSFPHKPENLDLTELEWRLVSPRLIFQKVHEAARGKQYKIHGNIVNVPADVINTVNILPRLSTETDTIKVQLKRKLKYKNYVLSQNIRPSKVLEAAKWLTENGALYKKESIKLNPDWNGFFTECNENDMSNDSACSSSMNLTEINTPVASVKSLNTTTQSLSEHHDGGLFSFQFGKVFICLDCEQVLIDMMNLENHLLRVHGIETDSECCEESDYMYIPTFHENDCNSNEVVFFCSLCSAWEKEQSLFSVHMAIVHDLPALKHDSSSEFSEATANVSTSSVVKLFRYKILDPQKVVLVDMCSKGYGLANTICLKALVGIPVTLNVTSCSSSGTDVHFCGRDLSKDSCPTEREIEDAWNEVDESEMYAGALDTMLTSPDFVEDCERDKVLNFAPGESSHPISVFKDQYCEELAYPGIFCGQARADNKERNSPVYYSDICKSELRHSDRRVAQCIENIFFKLKKLQMKIILGKCQIALRKHKTKGKKITAGELKKEGALDKLVHLDEGYRFLRALRGSPPYFEKSKKDLFAMIRQLGSATLFCSFSAAETKWNHLLRMLGELTDHRIFSDDELNALSWEEKSRLIQSDPVTCARHFDFQVQQLIVKFLQSDCAPLGKIADWFYRVEFQQRGSPHIHMLLWIEGAPKFGDDSDENVCKFVDKIISCSKPASDCELSELVSRQEHKHSFTCKKKFQKQCRFHFPQPPMKSTQILYPLSDIEEISVLNQHRATWKEINEQLNDMKEGDNISFEELFNKLGVAEDEYILAIRSSLSRATIFFETKAK